MQLPLALALALTGSATAGTHPTVWRVDLALESASGLRVLGRSDVTTHNVLLVELWQIEGRWYQRHRVCDVRVHARSRAAQTLLPEAFVAALDSRAYPVEIERDANGWRYRADAGPGYVGWSPREASRIPTDADHPAVFDQDGDGLPGGTILLRVPVLGDVELQVLQTSHWILEGHFTSEGGGGHVDLRQLEFQVIGASHPLFHASPRVYVRSGSAFTMRPVPRGTGCEALRYGA